LELRNTSDWRISAPSKSKKCFSEEKMSKQTVGSTLKRYRALAGLTQRQLGSEAGIEASKISLLESDQVQPSAEELEALNDVLMEGIRKRAKETEESLARGFAEIFESQGESPERAERMGKIAARGR